MAPRKEPTPTEVDSASDGELNFNFTNKPSTNITQAMESISTDEKPDADLRLQPLQDKWKSKRLAVQKGIDKDYAEQLSSLKNKIKKHYHDETQKRSEYNQQRLQRLMTALEKRIAIEEQINDRINSLRDDCAHIAMLINAVYAGRKEAAIQSARVANPSPAQN
ncbi:hypothetical protein Daesc_009988 [Daldinia eschscholtzii]|uniref:Uncharacterized protein n=1 Tax=Daldinia eschscholtzii TaxID=292717 RepID=A0AAX6M709_9PEZI